jgi:hypothetical protein
VRARPVIALGILVPAALAGGAIWYLQLHGYYRRLSPAAAAAQVVTLADGTVAALPVTAAEAIDADSSPIRYRACLTLGPDAPAPAALKPYPGAQVLRTPGWFACFDAAAIDAAIADGSATVALAEADRPWGVDRVVAIRGDRAWVWPQINRCGRAVFSGEPLPAGCPPKPES